MKKLIVTLLLILTANFAFAADKVVIFAASSATDLMEEIIKLYGQDNVVASYASSGVLAKQIEAGAPANIFLSANQEWMDYLKGKDKLDTDSRRNWLGNELALIANSDSGIKYKFADKTKLSTVLKDKKFAIGDPDHVPAGTYTREALQKLGLWQDIEKSTVNAENVRVVLTLVSRNEAPMGAVFASDLVGAKNVVLLDIIPTDADISYPISMVKGNANAETKKFYEFLKTPKVTEIVKKYGFKSL